MTSGTLVSLPGFSTCEVFFRRPLLFERLRTRKSLCRAVEFESFITSAVREFPFRLPGVIAAILQILTTEDLGASLTACLQCRKLSVLAVAAIHPGPLATFNNRCP